MDLANNTVDLQKLKGSEYQKKVFGKLIEYWFHVPNIQTIEDHMKGPVDYIIREKVKVSGNRELNLKHYFECKNYSRALELDNVAKIMVVAVAEKPDTVNIISRTPLQPQILDYASKLFKVGNSGKPIFESIEFLHWLTDKEFNIKRADIVPNSPTDGESKITWWLSLCVAFSQLEIASSELASPPIVVSYTSKLLLTCVTSLFDSGEISLFDLPEKSWGQSESFSIPENKVSFWIDTTFLSPGNVYPIKIHLSKGSSQFVFPIGDFSVDEKLNFLPELRTEEIKDLCSKIGPSGMAKLVAVEGEAGVGKTHLIEKVAEELSAKAGFDIIRFTVQAESNDNLMNALLRNCLAPPFESDRFDELSKLIEQAILSQTAGGTMEADFALLVRAASRIGQRMIVLRDCHLISTKLADQIWMFISTLDNISWGGIRLVLEYRQPDGRENLPLQALLKKIRLKIRKVFIEEKIKPITPENFSIISAKIFSHVTAEITDCLYQRTGGLPLFIDNYICRLVDIGVIERDAKGLEYVITQPAKLLADTLPEGGQIILVERVQILMKNKFGDDWQRWAIMLGLIAIGDDSFGRKIICDAMNLRNNKLTMLQSALEAAEIGYGRPDGNIAFRHDLLREAIIFMAVSLDDFPKAARKMIKNLLQSITVENEVQIRAIRIKVLGLIKDNIAIEIELRNGLKAAEAHDDYGRQISFLNKMLDLLKDRGDLVERFDFMSKLAWATWVSDSLWVARERYLQLAEAAEGSMAGDFSIHEDIATDAYRRALGIDLELVEPRKFLENAIAVLSRRQSYLTFNSIMNRLVLFCSRFGFPIHGYKLAELAFDYIGNGDRDNEGCVLCSELGTLYASCAPEVALSLFQRALEMAMNATERECNHLEIFINECLYQGRKLDLDKFSALWRNCSEGRFSETLTRASLLRGALLLRDRDMKNAGRWIERTATMVQLYRMKQFEIAVINDQIIYFLLCGEWESAKKHLDDLRVEFKRIEDEVSTSIPLMEQVCEAALAAAKKLPIMPSPIARPEAPPEYCDPLGEMRWNIKVLREILYPKDDFIEYNINPILILCPPVSEHRIIEVQGHKLILGAY